MSIDQRHFHVIRSEEVEWKPFAAFPPAARLAVLVGPLGLAYMDSTDDPRSGGVHSHD